MSTNGVEDADITECDGEKVVTMMDVLQEQQEFEEDANAVLGASDEKECTYSKGYIKRQAIYACLTCCSEAKDDPTQRAGVCLACSLNCHENHELIELYTKRNFRCDCGNPKFNSHPCQFTSNKIELNEDNNYNQNFSGIYCICHRPYPDLEATVEEEMIQCIICEDWLHTTHLEAVVPANDLYAEMICKPCMDKNEFLHDYTQIAVNCEIDADVTMVNVTEYSKISYEDSENTHLIIGTPNTSDILDANMANENKEKELKCIDISSKENKSINKVDWERDDKTENITSKDHTTENSEMLMLDETDTSKPMDNDHSENTNNFNAEPEQKDQISKPKIQETREMENETGPHFINSEESTINHNDKKDQEPAKVVDDKNELMNSSSEQNEESATEQVSNPNENSNRQENINLLKDINTIAVTTHGDRPNEISNDYDITLMDGGLNEKNTISSANDEQVQPVVADSPSDPTDNLSKKVPENVDIEKSQNQINVCEIDSLEAATKELSELMSDEGESNQNTIDSEKKKPNEVHTEQNSEHQSQANDNDFREDMVETNLKSLENDCKNFSSTEKDHKRKLNETAEEVLVKKQKLEKAEKCFRPRGVKRTIKGAAFWLSSFRQKLCTCNDCLSMYKDLSVLFLTDTDDTVTAYETLGKERIDGEPATQYEKGLQALSSLDRVQQINALTEYNKMRDKLLDFLKSFKDRKEIVKEEDIKAFFAGMKPRREPDGVYFCR